MTENRINELQELNKQLDNERTKLTKELNDTRLELTNMNLKVSEYPVKVVQFYSPVWVCACVHVCVEIYVDEYEY